MRFGNPPLRGLKIRVTNLDEELLIAWWSFREQFGNAAIGDFIARLRYGRIDD